MLSLGISLAIYLPLLFVIITARVLLVHYGKLYLNQSGPRIR